MKCGIDKETGRASIWRGSDMSQSVVPAPAYSAPSLPSRTTCVLGFSFNLRNSTPPLVHDIDMDVCSVNSIADGGAAPTEDFDSLVHLAAHCPEQLLSSPPSSELRTVEIENRGSNRSCDRAIAEPGGSREDGDFAGGLE